MASSKKNYVELDPNDPRLKKMAFLENPKFGLHSLVKYNPGGCALPESFDQYYDEVQEFPVEDSDIWIISFPKSGTTWTLEMVWLLSNNYDFEAAKKELDNRIVFFEYSGVQNKLKAFVETQDGEMSKSTFQIAREMSPRLIKSHLPWNLLPAKLRNGEKRPRIIYVARHPKDIIVSFYHHRVLTSGYGGSLDDKV